MFLFLLACAEPEVTPEDTGDLYLEVELLCPARSRLTLPRVGDWPGPGLVQLCDTQTLYCYEPDYWLSPSTLTVDCKGGGELTVVWFQ